MTKLIRLLTGLLLSGFVILASAQDQGAAVDQAACTAEDAVMQAELLAFAVQDADVSTPSLIENQAATGSGSTTSHVDGASRTNLLALAFDAGMVNSEGGVTTVSLAPLFDVIAMRDPTVVEQQWKYRDYEWARQLGIKITAGGQGDAFDRDGDGVVDDALTASSPSDIVTYEVSYQFGSRDRRDESNYELIMSRAKEAAAAKAISRSDAANVLLNAVAANRALEKLDCKELAQYMLDQDKRGGDFRAAIAAMHRAAGTLQPIVDEVAREIDGKPILRLVAQGTQRRAEFGGDKQSFGIRLSKGIPDTSTGGSNVDVELDYLRNELPNGGDELEGWKLGTKYTSTWLRKAGWFGDKGLLFSASGSVEKYSDVPASQHDSIARLDLTWSFHVGDKALVPLSITWANRTDLLQDKEDVIAHVGYSFDFDSFFQGAPH
jgi:hypothetical protein